MQRQLGLPVWQRSAEVMRCCPSCVCQNLNSPEVMVRHMCTVFCPAFVGQMQGSGQHISAWFLVLQLCPATWSAGYCGFVPSSQNNERACLQASGTLPQPRAQKADYLLHSLDQYSRQRVPLYTGHKAHGPAQVRVTPEAPSRLTTQARRRPSCHG